MQYRNVCIRAAVVLLTIRASLPVAAQQITNGSVQVRAVREGSAYTGFDVFSGGVPAAAVRLSSARLVTALRCAVGQKGRSLTFTGLFGRSDTALRLGANDSVTVALDGAEPYPRVSFDLTIAAFNPARWQAAAGKAPFHFLALYLKDAELWHQRGWLNATPLADPFPLLGDVHAGTPEISAYHYNRNWSYTPPLGAHPIPVIGLWAPSKKLYVGLGFQDARLEDNSEKDVATGYCWVPGGRQFAALVYPYGGEGYQQLVFPTAGSHLQSHGTLLWSCDLGASADPNELFWNVLWKRQQTRLPNVPTIVDLSWLPGGIRLKDFEEPGETYVFGPETERFVSPGTVTVNGWGWRNESPIPLAARNADPAALRPFEQQAETLLKSARRFTAGGDECLFWEKPLEGSWAPEWGGAAVTSLHNASGFAAGRLFLGLYRYAGHKEYGPVVDGIFNWARHIAWTRNEFADVPSSPFAIGGTLPTSFCLDYAAAFRGAPDALHRQRAAEALELARSFTYRYMIMWPSDNNRSDNFDSAFLWEPNSGRDWTGAACANEVFWNLDTLAQTAVTTGDPVLMWALQGSLERWHYLYQDAYKDTLADYAPADMTEGFGLYAGNVYGDGQRAHYGFASPLAMVEPVGNSSVRVLAGERAALAFDKHGVHTTIGSYRRSPNGDFSFTVRSTLPSFDLSLTAPYEDISQKPVTIMNVDVVEPLMPGGNFLRPPYALWSLYLKNVHDGDQITVGAFSDSSLPFPSTAPLSQRQRFVRPLSFIPPVPHSPSRLVSGKVHAPRSERPIVISFPRDSRWVQAEPLALPYDSTPDMNWDHLNSWAGLQRGRLWAYGISFWLAPPNGESLVSRPAKLERPLDGSQSLALLYTPGMGAAPSVLFSDGTRAMVDTRLEALAWQNWPPIYTSKLLMAPLMTGGKRVVGIDPGGRTVWAMSAFREPASHPGSPSSTRALLRAGAVQWRQEEQEETLAARVGQEAARIPQGSIALLPPALTGPAANFGHRSGLFKRAVVVTPEQLIDPAQFNAKRYPVALYAGAETYLNTVHTAGDAGDAIVRYVHEGGTLLLLSDGPWPMFYPSGPGSVAGQGQPLTPRLGLPLQNAIEMAPAEKLTVQLAPGQTVLQNVPISLPYPEGDPRLRSIDRKNLPAGSRYISIYRVLGASGKDYGDAAGVVELPAGGRVLYVWTGLTRNLGYGLQVTAAALRYLIRAASGTS